MGGNLYRMLAFANTPEGGNPAGVWVGDTLPAEEEMQRIAAEVGYSETAFMAPAQGASREIRYFSPEAEVSFCGHATIASAVVLGLREGEGTYHLATSVGDVPVAVRRVNGALQASLCSVDPSYEQVPQFLVDSVLAAMQWSRDDLDPSIPPAKAYAGAWHLVLAANSLDRLNRLEYDFDLLKELMLQEGLTTLQLVWRESTNLFHARNPFPVGGVVEDPATGAAAAALGGYLRESGLASAPFKFTIRQGEAMGRPSILQVEVPSNGGIYVTGSAFELSPDK